MLVSDREKTIEKCMKSLSSLRDAVPSELIVVDTAGNKTCMDIVRQYTDKIIRFEWCDDFAAARNAGLKDAKGKWVMFLDDDEWFENTSDLEQFFLSGAYLKYKGASYKVRNYQNIKGSAWDDFTALRLVERTEKTRFIGKIHEYLEPMCMPIYHSSDYVHHYGYLFTPEESLKHSQRNMKPLLEMLRESPDDLHTMTQLLLEYFSAKEYFAARELARKICSVDNCWTNGKIIRYVIYAAVQEVRIPYLQKAYQDAYEIGKKYMAEEKCFTLSKACICKIMAFSCSYLEKYDEALDYIDQFYPLLKKWNTYTEQELLDSFSIAQELLTPKEIESLRLLKLHAFVQKEDWDSAQKELKAFGEREEPSSIPLFTADDLMALLPRLDAQMPYMKAVRKILDHLFYRAAFYNAIEQADPSAREKVLAYLAQVTPDDLELCRYHIIYAGSQGRAADAIPALEKMRDAQYPFFLEGESYWDSLLKLNIDLNSYMTGVSIYDWIESAQRLWDVSSLKVCEKIYLCLIKGLEKTDLRYLYVSALFMGKKLDEKEKNAELLASSGADEVWNELFELSQYWVSCAATLYKEEVFMSNLIQALPPAYRFGWYIMQAGAVKNQDRSLFLRKVADAAKAYPALKELCKKVITEM